MNLKDYLVKYLRELANNIEADNSNITEEQASDILGSIAHIELKKAEAARFLNLSVRTFDRRVHDGIIPPGRHNINHKELVWYKDELVGCL